LSHTGSAIRSIEIDPLGRQLYVHEQGGALKSYDLSSLWQTFAELQLSQPTILPQADPQAVPSFEPWLGFLKTTNAEIENR
jgi:hypothetical protein